jgi:hypothetical protein
LKTCRDFLRGDTEGIGNSLFVKCKKARTGDIIYGEDVILVRQSTARLKPIKEEKPKKKKKNDDQSEVV